MAIYCLACGNSLRQQLLAQGTGVVIKPESELISELAGKNSDAPVKANNQKTRR